MVVMSRSRKPSQRPSAGWLAGFEPAPGQASIGLEVSTSNGDWHTIRQPVQLLCPLPKTAL